MSTTLSELELHAVDAAIVSAHNLMPGKTDTIIGLTFEQVSTIKNRIAYRNDHGKFDTRFKQYNVRVKSWLDDKTYTVQLEKIEVVVKVKNE